MLQQKTLPCRLEVAEDTFVNEILRLVVLAFLVPQVVEDGGRDLVALVGAVDLELVDAVRVEITGITAELNRVGDVHEVELPLVGGTTLHDVIDKLQLLEMFVRLAVELEVSLEISFV